MSPIPDVTDRANLERVISENLAFGKLFRTHFARLPPLEGKRVLEIGSGDGHESVFFALHGASVVGFDKRSTAIKNATDLATSHGVGDQCSFSIAQIESLPCPENSFDLVFSKSVLQYTDRQRIFDECIRVLKPGGTLLMIENTPYSPIVNIARLIRRAMAGKKDMEYLRTIRGYMRYSEARRVMHRLDAPSYACRHILSPMLIYWIWSRRLPHPPLLGRAERVLERADDTLIRALPPLRHIAWIGCLSGRKPAPTRGDTAPGAPR